MRTFFISENREDLYHTIDRRCEEMLLRGFLREVFELLLSGELNEVPWYTMQYNNAIQQCNAMAS